MLKTFNIVADHRHWESKFLTKIQTALKNKLKNTRLIVSKNYLDFPDVEVDVEYFVIPHKPLDKLEQYSNFYLNNVPHVPWTTDTDKVVNGFLGKKIIVRTLLNASSGQGMAYIDLDKDSLPEAKVYTKYINIEQEQRIHMFNNKCILWAAKYWNRFTNKFEYDYSPPNKFGTHIVNFIVALARQAVKACDYYYGAIDIVKSVEGNYYVLEVNTQPGMGEHTLNAYVTAIINNYELE